MAVHSEGSSGALVAALAALSLVLPSTGAAQSADLARLTEDEAVELALAHPKVVRWLDRYPPSPTTSADYRPESRRGSSRSGRARPVRSSQVVVEDSTGSVVEAWTGPAGGLEDGSGP